MAHETIVDPYGEVWMNAMTMEFPVRDGKEFQKLKQGMRIEAMVVQEVDGYDYWMQEIQEK